MSEMINLLIMMMTAMMTMAFYTLSERKFLGYMQYRKGPNKPMLAAMTIPMADATKLFSKEEKNNLTSNMKYYFLAPMIMITMTILLWPIFPHYSQSFFMKLSMFYFLCITSMMIYTTFMAGWSSNSKWSLLGALRGIAQTISYEVSLSLILICFIIHMSSMNLSMITRDQYSWIIIFLLPMSMAWIISIFAETHRTPLDFTEGESELVSGFNTEYSSSMFALIFMAEYINILMMSLLSMSIMTKNFHSMELITKSTIMSLMFIWARGSLPRMRYDILMNMLWKIILPNTLMWMFMIMSINMVTK